MRAVESEGATVEQAVERALILLDLSRDLVEVEVLKEPGDGNGTVVVRVAPKSRTRNDTENNDQSVVSRETSGLSHAATEELGSDEAEQARGILAELLSHMGLACRLESAELEEDGQRTRLSVAGEDTALVIGRQGQTLDAIELVLNRIMERRWPGSRPVTVDAEDYRDRRAQKLADGALQEAEKVKRTGHPIALEPMSPRDRRSIHLALHDEPGVSTRSEGEGAFRHIIVEPARPLGQPGPWTRTRQ